MKKALLIGKLTLSIFSAALFSFNVNGQAIFIENFDYVSGTNLTSNGWTAHSGAGSQPVTVNSTGLNFAGYPSSGIGLSALVDNTGEDVHRTFTPVSTGSVYCAFMVNVTSVSAGYFLHLNDNPIGTTFRARVFLDGTSPNFNFGLSKGSNTGTFTSGSPYTTGSTYLLVVKYTFVADASNDEVSLYVIDGTIPASEPVTPTIGPLTDAAISDLTNVASVALRQYSATQNIVIDGIRIASKWSDVISESIPPVPTFNPANNATDVAVSVNPTITFDEPVRKTDGSELVNADLASLITFKKTDASGDNVPFTATIDATKKVITVTPSAALINSQLYYLAVGLVEDNQGNESTLKSITFTTIAASTPTITVIYPNGGEVMYSGENKTITWSTTNFDVAETIKVEVWAIDGLTGNYTWRTLSPSTPNDGAYETLVGPDALYGTEYKIRLSGVTNGATDTSDGPFTVISTAATMADLRTYDPGTIIRYEGEAIITFIRTDNRNQKYLQDATGGLLIDDASGVLTTTLANGDKIRYLEGQLGLFAGTLQLVPTKSAVTVISSGNSVTPATMTLPQYLANHTAYESMLVKLTDVYFQGADGTSTFAASTNYTLTDGTNTLQFRTFKATESNIVGTIIPVPHLDLTGIGGIFNTTVQIYSRTTADFSLLTGVDRTREPGISIYPVPATTDLFIRSRMAEVTGIEILDVTGKVVMRFSESSAELIRIPVSTLRKGIYFIKVETAGGKIIRRFVKS